MCITPFIIITGRIMKRVGLAILLLLNAINLYGKDFSTFSISDEMMYFEEEKNEERKDIYIKSKRTGM